MIDFQRSDEAVRREGGGTCQEGYWRCPPWQAKSLRLGNKGVNFRVSRETAKLLFREHQPAIGDDLKDAVCTLDEFDLVGAFRQQPVSRTESAGLVVSNDAIFDREFHELCCSHIARRIRPKNSGTMLMDKARWRRLMSSGRSLTTTRGQAITA